MSDVKFEKFQNAGDIVLVRTPKRVPLNRLAQSVATARRANYTHVLLCVMPGLYIHSVVKPGVHFVAAEDDEGNFPAHYGKWWKVVRNRKIAQDQELMAQVAFKAMYYIGQGYNGAFAISTLLPRRFKASRSFCSELVAKIYADLGCPLSKLNPARILPVHIDAATKDSAQWEDVTPEYEMHLTGNFVAGAYEDSLDEHFPIPDMRQSFVRLVQLIIDDAIAGNQIGDLSIRLNDLTSKAPSTIQRMSEKELEEFAKEMNINTRSFKSQLAGVIEAIFELDRGFLNRERERPSGVAQTWIKAVSKPLQSADLDGALVGLHRLVATLRKSHFTLAEALLNSSEIISIRLATFRLIPSTATEESVDLVKRQIAHTLSLIESLLDFDNYEMDLEDLHTALKKNLASSSLGTDKAIGLLRVVAQHIQWRRHTASLKLAERLTMLQTQPTDYDLAYALYSDILTIVPYAANEEAIHG